MHISCLRESRYFRRSAILLAAAFAIGLIFILMPLFNQVSGKQLIFNLAVAVKTSLRNN